MKLLFLHCDYIKFKAKQKALKEPEELTEEGKKLTEVKEPLVVFCAVEKHDEKNNSLIENFISEVKDVAGKVNAKNIVLYPYAHLSSSLSNPKFAEDTLKKAEETLKKEFKVVRAPFGYYKEFELKCKGHPLSELSRTIGDDSEELKVSKEIKVNKKNQSGDGKIILDRRNLLPNDHRIIGEDLGLFHLSDEIGPGLPLWLPNGEIIRNELEVFMREIENKYGYKYVSTPHITKGGIYEKTGHVPYYTDTMFPPIQIDGIDYYLKPMNCPHHHIIYSKIVKSYRDLPLRLAEPGLVYRNELSGVTYGLIRVRAITQNDAHIYVRPKELKEEFLKVLEMFEEVYKIMGIKDYYFRLSLPDFKKNPEKFTGDEKEWEFASEEIRKAMKKYGKKFIEEKGEAAFYGPKIDVQIKNANGKEETIATSQVDIVIPKRMNLTYIDDDNKKKHPIIIHRAILGSYERFIAYLLEQTEGRLPLWLSPVQLRIINFTERNEKFVINLLENIKKEMPKLRIDSDLRSTTVSDKIRDAELSKIPYIIVIGDKEEKEKTLAIRQKGKVKSMDKNEFIEKIKKEIENKK